MPYFQRITKSINQKLLAAAGIDLRTAHADILAAKAGVTPATAKDLYARGDVQFANDGAMRLWQARMTVSPSEAKRALLQGLDAPDAVMTVSAPHKGQEGLLLDLSLPGPDGYVLKHRLDHDSREAYLDLIAINSPSRQGGGIAKTLLRNMVSLASKSQVDQVSLYANIDVGSYAWARYGFMPTPMSWEFLAPELASRAEPLVPRLSRASQKALEFALNSPDPRALWLISDLKETIDGTSLGKRLLVGATWEHRLPGIRQRAAELRPTLSPDRQVLLDRAMKARDLVEFDDRVYGPLGDATWLDLWGKEHTGIHWYGVLPFENDAAMRRFNAYIGGR